MVPTWHFHVSALSILIPLILGIFLFKDLSKDLRLFMYYIVLSFVTDLVSFIVMSYSYRNAPILNIFTVLEFIFLIYILSIWNTYKIFIIIFKALIPLFVIAFVLLDILGVEKFNEIKTISRTISIGILIIFSVITLFTISDAVKIPIYLDPRFWITSGILIYCAGNLLLFLFGIFIYEGEEIYFIHNFSNILANIFYAGGLFCSFKLKTR